MPKESCLRCQFLFTRDTGYSNWTVEGAELHCVYGKNRNLPMEMPDEYGPGSWVGVDGPPTQDRWFATRYSRCELYRERGLDFRRVNINVEGDNVPEEKEAREAFLQGDVMPLMVRKYMSGEVL